MSQRDFLHRAADLDDIDTVRQAADDSICAAIDAHSPGGIYFDHRCGCRAVTALDGYRAVNHLDCHLWLRRVGDAGIARFHDIGEVTPRLHTAVGIDSLSGNEEDCILKYLISKPRITFQWFYPMTIHRGQAIAIAKRRIT